MAKVSVGLFQFLSHPSLQILYSFKDVLLSFCTIYFLPLIVSNQLLLLLRNAFGDIFNVDVSHYVFVFGRFQLSHDHNSRQDSSLAVFGLHPFKLEVPTVLPLLLFSGTFYVRQHKPIIRQILSHAVSWLCAPCFPFVSRPQCPFIAETRRQA